MSENSQKELEEIIEEIVEKEVRDELREIICKPLTLGASISLGVLGVIALVLWLLVAAPMLGTAILSGWVYYKLRGEEEVLSTETKKRLRELRAKYEENP